MVRVNIPFGKGTLSFNVHPSNLLGVVEPKKARGVARPEKEIQRALSKPIASKRLSKLAKPGQRVAIVVTDHTRPCPDKLILPELLRELKAAGVRLEDIVVVIGTGVHRKMRLSELRAKFGRLRGVEILNHDPRDAGQLVYLGRTRARGEIYINRHVAQSDLVVAVGVVEPHQYAGFSGGRKLVAVGVAGERTIAHTHQPRFINARGTRLGRLRDNPFHRELVEIASKTRLRFTVNVVLNAEHELVRCFAGEPASSFEAAAKLARKLYIRPVGRPADVLVLGVGHPKDIDLYQASRGITYAYFATRPAVRQGGVIILAAPCPEGTGDPRFEQLFRCSRSPIQAVRRARQVKFEPGEQRAYMLARVLKQARVILVGSMLSEKLLREMFIESAPTIDDALEMAFQRLGRGAKVLVIPHSALTIPNLRG
jgi:nickel-dependent lactate racemase